MSTNEAHTTAHNTAAQNASHSYTNGNTNGYTNGNTNGTTQANDFEKVTRDMSHEEKAAAIHASRFGYGPLAHMRTNDGGNDAMLPAFGGEFQPGLYKPVSGRKFANPAPLGLSAFALTTFVLSLINMNTRGLAEPNIVIALAFGYGGLVQLLAGMWEMAVGNTFGATALSSYGGFWISFAIILTPGGFEIVESIETAGGPAAFTTSLSFFLFGWFIFTTILLVCTLKSTLAFFLLFFTLDLAFLMLALGYYYGAAGPTATKLLHAGGGFGIVAAFLAWYNALAGIADTSNSFFIIPVVHLPWSETGKQNRGKSTREMA